MTIRTETALPVNLPPFIDPKEYTRPVFAMSEAMPSGTTCNGQSGTVKEPKVNQL